MSLDPKTIFVKKRERTQNWVPEEKRALFELVKMHVNAIENKKLDATTAALKNMAWNQIYSAFRGKFTTERDIGKIKSQWARMKAQSRIAMYTFAAKVKILGTEEASKNMPSQLLIAVWQLLRTFQKNDCDGGERSDESSQDVEGSNDIDAILDKLPFSNKPEVSNVMEIKIEPTWDDYEEAPVETNNINSTQRPVEILVRRRKSTLFDNGETINPVDKKRMRVETSGSRSHEDSGKEEVAVNEDTIETSINPEDMSNSESSVDRAVWMIEAAQREHKLKLRTLNTDLERAELQKQAAINELLTSEMKKKLTEAQAAEYYSQLRMSGDPGSGAGRGGGGGGSIRSAGGSFGKMEAAHEDQYFYNQQKQQLEHLREELHDEISFHEEQIKRHQEAIHRHKDRIGKMTKE